MSVRIGYTNAFWGDTDQGARQLLQVEGMQYLVADYLAEVTMALLSRQRARHGREAGFIADGVEAIVSVAAEARRRGIRIVTNAGGMEPAACAAAIRARLADLGVDLRVAAVVGDDLSALRGNAIPLDAVDMFTGEKLPSDLASYNAYLGARPIAAALGAGADVVVTGRCVDSAVVLGPLMHEHGWRDDQYDLLSAGALVGHVLECGPQCTGGLHTDWWAVPGWDDMGFPYADVDADGTAVIAKPAGTGGLVTPATVSEQILYEIADPGAYVLPDVVCDWRGVTAEQVGPDRVRVAGAVGSAPTATYKASATAADGYRVTATAMFAGSQASGRARRAGHAAVARTARLAGLADDPFTDVSIELVGAGETTGAAATDATEAVLKVGLRHPRRDPLQTFAREWAGTALVAQGMTGFFAGRPRVSPVHRVLHVLVGKTDVAVAVDLDGTLTPVTVADGDPDAVVSTPVLAEDEQAPDPGWLPVPLRRLAWARSGDKGDNVNIGLIARRPEYLDVITAQVTAERVGRFFGHYRPGGVRRWSMPGLGAVNVVLEGVLGGCGGTSTLRYDSQGKSYGAMLLTMPVYVPREWPALTDAP
ncbi:MAG: hypothetical protein ABS81_02460 [Pseudonocardia sp. SCN 72-86]|nr:MAG: hypothetical protein ABS81_02460 [Pseudonocardia sp. SCN 72-86]